MSKTDSGKVGHPSGKVKSPNRKAKNEEGAEGGEIATRKARTQAMPPRLRMSHAIVSRAEALLTQRFHAGKFMPTIGAAGHFDRNLWDHAIPHGFEKAVSEVTEAHKSLHWFV